MATLPAPHTWTAGDDATSAYLQTLTDAINFLKDPPRCRAWQSVSQNCTTGTETAITFTSEDVDTDGIHSTTVNTSRFTCVTAGRYKFVGSVGIAGNANGTRTVRLKLNGATTKVAVRQAGNATNTFLEVTEDILLVAGDYIELTMQQDSGSTLATSAATDVTFLHAVWVSNS